MITLAHKPLLSLTHTAVRDLAWACFSTPIIECCDLQWEGPPAANCQLGLSSQRMAWLEALDRQPDALEAHLADAKSARLGLYVESLWHFFLTQDPLVDLLSTNLAVREGGRTIGEFDVLYYCHQRRRHVHLELAVKFYLCSPGLDGSEWRHWLGPNRRDRLDLKLDRLIQHQLALSARPESAPLLAELGIDNPLREMEIKGRLFAQNPDVSKKPPGWPANKNMDCYLRAHSSDLAASIPAGGQPLERRQWLAPVDASSLPQREDKDRGDRAFVAAEFDRAGREKRRYFVVPPDWPDSAEPSSQG
ncbi:DUF1853 family protein [Halioglobus maricola]|uniref:DUF1853 family protein n=1 Tax=Halioglobus maricola TaxID=2601894 RepID=A0A5P9NKY0_9GAMM|nr:DUF1853 family protein [Halioglobus maricola]QFU76402.1 DUF1853 family protein [Halioglobus maricola]